MYIKIQEIKSKHGYIPKGILHLGAHLGEEAKDYFEQGIKNVIWIEGNPDLLDELSRNVSVYPGNLAYNLLISDRDNADVIFNITEFSQSSSILELGITEQVHNTSIVQRRHLKANRVDSFFNKMKLDINQYNFVNLDLQGYELIALKSMGQLLDKLDWVYTEINIRSLYKECALLYQMDLFLLHKGFIRTQTHMTPHFWGDALYKRTNPGIMEKIIRISGIYMVELYRRISRQILIAIKSAKYWTKWVVKKILFIR